MVNGVITVSPPADVCNMKWRAIGNAAYASLGIYDGAGGNYNNIQTIFKMIVMPDCVDFEDAAAWGQTPGDLTWLPSRHASYPIAQVHELG